MPVAAPNQSVTWNSSNTAVATVSADGVILALVFMCHFINPKWAAGGKRTHLEF